MSKPREHRGGPIAEEPVMSVDKMRVTALTVCAGLGGFESTANNLEGILPNAKSVHVLFYHSKQLRTVYKIQLPNI